MPGIFQPLSVTIASLYLYWVIVRMCRLYCLFAICFLHQFCLPLTVAFHPVHPIVGALLGPHFLQRSLTVQKSNQSWRSFETGRCTQVNGWLNWLFTSQGCCFNFISSPPGIFFHFFPPAQLFICKGIVSISSSTPVYFLMECLELLHMAR